jgi:hypothetical protein
MGMMLSKLTGGGAAPEEKLNVSQDMLKMMISKRREALDEAVSPVERKKREDELSKLEAMLAK